MRDPVQDAKDGLWLSLVKGFGMHGIPSETDDSTIPVELRKKAQKLLPELEKTWLVDDYTLPKIQSLPAVIEQTIAAVQNPVLKNYPIHDIGTELSPLVPSIAAIKEGDLMLEAMKPLDAAQLALMLKMIASESLFEDLKGTSEGRTFLEQFQPVVEGYRDAWDNMKESLAGYFFSWISSKVGDDAM